MTTENPEEELPEMTPELEAGAREVARAVAMQKLMTLEEVHAQEAANLTRTQHPG